MRLSLDRPREPALVDELVHALPRHAEEFRDLGLAGGRLTRHGRILDCACPGELNSDRRMAVRELRPSSGRREVLRGGAAAPGSLGHEPLAAQRPEEAQLALSLAQHPDEHRPRRLVLLEPPDNGHRPRVRTPCCGQRS